LGRAITQLERLHRCLLELIKLELDRQASERQVTSVQALFLYNIGDRKLSAAELRIREHYTDANLSYTIAKLVEGVYLVSALKRLEHHWAEHIRYGF
jgi:hypothetical protein